MAEERDQGVLSAGDSVGGYTVRKPVGDGSTGRVYSAIHPITGDKVAVRVVHPFLTAPEQSADQLLSALTPLVGLKHDNLLTLHACGRTDSGAVYLITEFVQGRPLSDLLGRSAPLVLEEAHPLLTQLAAGLEAAHSRGVVHGALNTDNIWLSPRTGGAWPPRLRVMDIGPGGLLPLEDRLPYYLAPEQCRGEPARLASDLYALGVIAWQMLTGRLPFSSPRPAEVRRLHVEQAPPPLAEDLPDELRQLLVGLLAKETDQRPESMGEALARLSAGESRPPRKATEPGRKPTDTAAGTAPQEADTAPAEEAPAAPLAPVPTAEVVHPKPRRLALTPFLSAVLAVVAAIVVGALAFRVLTGQWPLAPGEAVAAEGRLLVRTLPPGAAVYLNGTRQPARTPLTVAPLRQGQAYELFVHLPGHGPWRQRIALGLGEAERVLEIPLARRALRFGSLKLSSSVKADFFLDSRRVGTQALELTLADVQADVDHRLRISAPGHRTVEQVVRVPSGKLRVLEFVMVHEE